MPPCFELISCDSERSNKKACRNSKGMESNLRMPKRPPIPLKTPNNEVGLRIYVS